MTIPLTDAQIRAFLDDIGLPQVDPTQFRVSTLGELIRANIDLGRIRPKLVNDRIIQIDYSSGVVGTGPFIGLIIPDPNQIAVARNLSINFLTGNVENIIVQQRYSGSTIHVLWDDKAFPFAAGPYIGTNNDESRAWGALNLDSIVTYGENPDFNNLKQRLEISLSSAAAVDKLATIQFHADVYEWEDWPGW